MWLLIVVSTLYNHAAYDSIYSFQKFNTQSRCEAVAAWVRKRGSTRVEATCVFNGKEEQ